MSWISKNKFMVGFGAVMLIGVGTLGYFTYSAADSKNTADGEYETSLTELKRLQGGHPYPEKINTDKLIEQKASLKAKIDDLQRKLADSTLPVTPISPTAFQDKLKESVTRVKAKAGEANLTLPDKFYMGFPEYASKPPEMAAAPLLGRELVVFESIINQMLAAKDVKLLELKPNEPSPAPNPKEAKKVVQHTGFTLKFESSENAFRSILNSITTNKEQFYIVRKIAVKNTNQNSPAKIAAIGFTPPETPKDPSAAPTPAVAPPEPSKRLEYIFGTERLEVHLELEIVDFLRPEATAKPDKKVKEAK